MPSTSTVIENGSRPAGSAASAACATEYWVSASLCQGGHHRCRLIRMLLHPSPADGRPRRCRASALIVRCQLQLQTSRPLSQQQSIRLVVERRKGRALSRLRAACTLLLATTCAACCATSLGSCRRRPRSASSFSFSATDILHQTQQMSRYCVSRLHAGMVTENNKAFGLLMTLIMNGLVHVPTHRPVTDPLVFSQGRKICTRLHIAFGRTAKAPPSRHT